MKLMLASLLASASVMAVALPNPSTLVDQTVAQAQAQSVAEHYATAAIPRPQAAIEPTRDEEYRRIQEDMQKWFPTRDTKRGFKIQWHETSASRPR